MKPRTPTDWAEAEAATREIADPMLRERMLEIGRRARAQEEAIARAETMKRPSGHTPAVQRIYDLVDANRTMFPAELWDTFGPDPMFIGMSEANFKKRAGEARAELRRSGRLEK